MSIDVGAATQELPGLNPRRSRALGTAIFYGLLLVSAVLATLILVAPMERQMLGLVVVVLTISLMLLGIHVAVAMAAPSLLGLWVLGGERTVAFALEEIPMANAASWSLSVLPTFIFMGLMIAKAGIAEVIFDAAKKWLGGLPGGLAAATIFSGAGMSAASGSTLGVTYANSRIAVPEMLNARYSPSFAAGTVTMAGVLKMLIPPSITVVIYAGIAQTPVGPQLLAGVVPGLILALLFAGLIIFRAKLNPGLAPAVDLSGVTWQDRFVALLKAWPVYLLIVIIVGGMYTGVATATEAGAVAMLTTILISGWIGRHKGFRPFLGKLAETLLQTVAAVTSIMFLIISVGFLTLMISMSGIVQLISRTVVNLGLSATTFLLILIVMYTIMGMFMDELAMILLTVPILLPVLTDLGINPIWFGVFLILLCEVGMTTPPVGLLSFVVHSIVQDPEVNRGHAISLIDVFRGVFWFVVVAQAFIVLLIFLPDLALWLPEMSSR